MGNLNRKLRKRNSGDCRICGYCSKNKLQNCFINQLSFQSQFDSHDLNDLYKPYTDKISHGYFSLFLILEFCLNVTHFVVLLVSNYNANVSFNIFIRECIAKYMELFLGPILYSFTRSIFICGY